MERRIGDVFRENRIVVIIGRSTLIALARGLWSHRCSSLKLSRSDLVARATQVWWNSERNLECDCKDRNVKYGQNSINERVERRGM